MPTPKLPCKWDDMTREQRREYSREYRRLNYERRLAKEREWRAKKSAELKEKQRKYYIENRESIRAKSRAYYLRTADAAKRRAKEWRLKHPEAKAAYRERNRRKLANKSLAQYYRDYGKHLFKHAKYREKNREKLRAACRARAAQVTETHAREILSKYSPISAHEWPIELVRAKQEQLKLKRIVKNEKHNRATI